MIKLKLVFTRPCLIPALMGWYQGIGQYLQKEIGIGMTENIVYYKDGVIKSYRSDRELKKVKKFILKHPKIVIKQLRLADIVYPKLKNYKNRMNLDYFKKQPTLLDDFYQDYLASWKPNFFALWAPQLIRKGELKEYGLTIFKLAKQVRQKLDPLVFVSDLYLKLIQKIKKDKKLFFLCKNKEIEKYLQGKLTPHQKGMIMKRSNGLILFRGHSRLAKSFKEAKDYIKEFGYIVEEEKFIPKVTALKGWIASRGKTVGTVKLLFKYEDNKKVKKGNIIVSPMTTSAFMTAIRKCGAIVTDEGGITCHAAIVARELKKPCVIDTKIATKVLKDGDRVEVDANKGLVKKL